VAAVRIPNNNNNNNNNPGPLPPGLANYVVPGGMAALMLWLAVRRVGGISALARRLSSPLLGLLAWIWSLLTGK
jgi:hypothetical protein